MRETTDCTMKSAMGSRQAVQHSRTQGLHRSPKTMNHHVSAILEKLEVHSRTEAVATALARGMFSATTTTPRPHGRQSE
jgi:hypothetical protein